MDNPWSEPSEEPQPAQPRRQKTLTVGMAVYDDFNGVYFYRPGAPALSPGSHAGRGDNGGRQQPRRACRRGSGCPGRADRNPVHTFWVMCIDCHVILVPGALQRFLDYAAADPDSCGLLQGPLLDDNLGIISTHFRPVWNNWMWGEWATDDRGLNPDAAPFDIPMQGLGLFACRKDAWPGFNPRFRGFGG